MSEALRIDQVGAARGLKHCLKLNDLMTFHEYAVDGAAIGYFDLLGQDISTYFTAFLPD